MNEVDAGEAMRLASASSPANLPEHMTLEVGTRDGCSGECSGWSCSWEGLPGKHWERNCHGNRNPLGCWSECRPHPQKAAFQSSLTAVQVIRV